MNLTATQQARLHAEEALKMRIRGDFAYEQHNIRRSIMWSLLALAEATAPVPVPEEVAT